MWRVKNRVREVLRRELFCGNATYVHGETVAMKWKVLSGDGIDVLRDMCIRMKASSQCKARDSRQSFTLSN